MKNVVDSNYGTILKITWLCMFFLCTTSLVFAMESDWDCEVALVDTIAYVHRESEPSVVTIVKQDTSYKVQMNNAIVGLSATDEGTVLAVGVDVDGTMTMSEFSGTQVQTLLQTKGQLPRGIGIWRADSTWFGLSESDGIVNVLARKNGEVSAIGSVGKGFSDMMPLDSTAVVIVSAQGVGVLQDKITTQLWPTAAELQRTENTLFAVDAANEVLLKISPSSIDTLSLEPFNSGSMWKLAAANRHIQLYRLQEPWRTVLEATRIGPQLRFKFKDGGEYVEYGSMTVPVAVALLILIAAYNWRRLSKNRHRLPGITRKK